MPQEKLKTIAEGIFFSLLNYCIESFGNVWGLESFGEDDRHSTAFRKEDNRKLQVLMNKVLRSMTGLDYETPVSVLLDKSGQLSVHQKTALFTLTSVHKALISTHLQLFSIQLESRLCPESPPSQPLQQSGVQALHIQRWLLL